MGDDLFALVKEHASKYRALIKAYDETLRKAHKAGHGTPEMIQYLCSANGMAAEVMDALKQY